MKLWNKYINIIKNLSCFSSYKNYIIRSQIIEGVFNSSSLPYVATRAGFRRENYATNAPFINYNGTRTLITCLPSESKKFFNKEQKLLLFPAQRVKNHTFKLIIAQIMRTN